MVLVLIRGVPVGRPRPAAREYGAAPAGILHFLQVKKESIFAVKLVTVSLFYLHDVKFYFEFHCSRSMVSNSVASCIRNMKY